MTVTESLPVVDAVRRGLEIDEQFHQGRRQVRAVLTLTTNNTRSPAQLWPLLTVPRELARWFGPVAGELREGGRFLAPGGTRGRVREVAEPHRLALDWEPGPDARGPVAPALDPDVAPALETAFEPGPGPEGQGPVAPAGGAQGADGPPGAPSEAALSDGEGGGADPLLIRLDPEDDGTTLLSLRHTALIDAEEFERIGPGGLALGWEIALLALAAHTDGWRTSCLSGVPVPSPDWLNGPEGAAYVRAWSVRWAAEALAAGVEEEAARRGEAETTRRLRGV